MFVAQLLGSGCLVLVHPLVVREYESLSSDDDEGVGLEYACAESGESEQFSDVEATENCTVCVDFE